MQHASRFQPVPLLTGAAMRNLGPACWILPIRQTGPFLISQASQIGDWHGVRFCFRHWFVDCTVYQSMSDRLTDRLLPRPTPVRRGVSATPASRAICRPRAPLLAFAFVTWSVGWRNMRPAVAFGNRRSRTAADRSQFLISSVACRSRYE